jgi:hypothetical protein
MAAKKRKKSGFRAAAARKARHRRTAAKARLLRTMRAEHIPLNRGGYDSRGRYYGVGRKVYRVMDFEGETLGELRADNAAEAKESAHRQGWLYAGGSPGHMWSSR